MKRAVTGKAAKVWQLHAKRDVSIIKPTVSATKTFLLQVPGAVVKCSWSDLEAVEVLIKRVREDEENDRRSRE